LAVDQQQLLVGRGTQVSRPTDLQQSESPADGDRRRS
jgi:hypothetical protein